MVIQAMITMEGYSGIKKRCDTSIIYNFSKISLEI